MTIQGSHLLVSATKTRATSMHSNWYRNGSGLPLGETTLFGQYYMNDGGSQDARLWDSL